MGMSRCYSFMKCLLILFSIVFLVVGLGVAGLAGWALWDGRASDSEGGSARAGLCALLGWAAALAAGALAALVGAGKRSASLLAAAFALLALTAVAEAAAAWWGAAHLPQLERALRDRLEHSLRVDYGVMHSRTQVLDAIQQGLECCGAEGPRDWQHSAWSMAQSERLREQRGEARGEAPSAAARHDALDLSVGAPSAYYYVPTSCCATLDAQECELARLVPAASGGAPGLFAAACAPRVLQALEAGARAPLLAGAALLAAHAVALLLALALCLRADPDTRYKA